MLHVLESIKQALVLVLQRTGTARQYVEGHSKSGRAVARFRRPAPRPPGRPSSPGSSRPASPRPGRRTRRR
nr:hypothetical protein [Micromonospora sp. MH33]